MELADVDRAVSRTGRYFFDDGLWEIAVGVWLASSVAFPVLAGGVVAPWAVFTVLLVRPAVMVAKSRWVFPRTGRVSYPAPAAARAGRRNAALAVAAAAAVAVPLAMLRGLPAWDAPVHVAVGVITAAAFTFAAWRWEQRRWNLVAVLLLALGLVVASSHLDRTRALQAHAGGIAIILIASGACAFAGYLRHAPAAGAEADGR